MVSAALNLQLILLVLYSVWRRKLCRLEPCCRFRFRSRSMVCTLHRQSCLQGLHVSGWLVLWIFCIWLVLLMCIRVGSYHKSQELCLLITHPFEGTFHFCNSSWVSVQTENLWMSESGCFIIFWIRIAYGIVRLVLSSAWEVFILWVASGCGFSESLVLMLLCYTPDAEIFFFHSELPSAVHCCSYCCGLE